MVHGWDNILFLLAPQITEVKSVFLAFNELRSHNIKKPLKKQNITRIMTPPHMMFTLQFY